MLSAQIAALDSLSNELFYIEDLESTWKILQRFNHHEPAYDAREHPR